MDNFHSFKLHHLVRQLDKYADSFLMKSFGISYSRFLCLVAIHHEQPVTQHDVATELLVSDAVVSRMIGPLTNDGYIVTKIDPSHAKRKIVSLTDKAGLQ